MRNKLKSVMMLVVLLSGVIANAHQPDISSLTLIEQESGIWTVQINASMTAFQYEVRSAFGEDSYASPEEFNQLVLEHFRKNIMLRINGEDVTLNKGFVKLGHATAAVFELGDVPVEIEHVWIKNEGFKNIHDSQSIFSIVKHGLNKKTLALSEDNNYQTIVSLENNEMFISETPLNNRWSSSIIIIIALGMIIFFVIKIASKRGLHNQKSLSNA